MSEINYQVLNNERTNQVHEQFQQKLQKRGMGNARPGSLRYTVLTNVVNASYDKAKEELEIYLSLKSDFPNFESRVRRYVDHCKDLISAIKSKRNFPGLSSLPGSKQQEILEKVLDHYDELMHYLKRIEGINAETTLNDLRSTVFVIRTMSYCVGIIVFLFFLTELFESIYGSYNIMVTDAAKDFTDWIFDLGF